MSSYIVEPWGRDKYRQAGVLFNSEAVCAEMDRLVARLVEQEIDPATFERYVVDEDRKPIAGPEAQQGTAVGGRRNIPARRPHKSPPSKRLFTQASEESGANRQTAVGQRLARE
jgi:hypothetical protein